MSATAFAAFVIVAFSTIIGVTLAEKKEELENKGSGGAKLLSVYVALVALLMIAVTTVPMFVMNGLMDMSSSVLISSQLGVLAFVYVAAE